MAFTGDFMCTSFKQELMVKGHDFTLTTGDQFKIALFTNSATLNAATTAYPGASPSNEVVGTGYTEGGANLTNVTPTTSGTTAFTDFADVTWASSTITARGAMIYNDDDAGDAAVVILDFTEDKSSSNGDFTIQFPTADASNAIIRIA